MTTILTLFWKQILGWAALVVAIFFIRKSAADAVKNKNKEAILNDIREAKKIRDDLDSDPVKRNRVRERFTRD